MVYLYTRAVLNSCQTSEGVTKVMVRHNCDQIWENPPYETFRENRDRTIYQKYYLRTNLAPNLSGIAQFVFEI